jgi:hypothetical protein
LLGVALISLAWCLAIVDRDARSAFFSAPGRAWELLLGALLAVRLVPVLQAAWQREVMAAGGLLLITGSVLLMTRDTVFPGLAALPPTLGAAMLIHAGQPAPDGSNHRAWASRLLEIRPAVFIGLISYSLYLLHWPLFAFAHGLHDGPMAIEVRLWLIATAFALAVFSWKFVETPFRRPAQPMARQRLLMLAAGIMAITSLGAMGASQIAARQLGQSDQVAAGDVAHLMRQHAHHFRRRARLLQQPGMEEHAVARRHERVYGPVLDQCDADEARVHAGGSQQGMRHAAEQMLRLGRGCAAGEEG